MSAKRVLMLVGDFVEDYEAMVPLQILFMVGHQVDVACPGKNKGDSVATSIHDFDGFQTYSEKRGHNFTITVDWNAAKLQANDALYIPGGRSPEYLQLNEEVLAVVRHFFEAGKPVAAICHGPQVLAAAGVLKGRRCQAYPGARPQVVDAGAAWDQPSPGLDSVCVDRNFASAPAWPAQYALMREFLRLLGTPVGK
jgi:protease I